MRRRHAPDARIPTDACAEYRGWCVEGGRRDGIPGWHMISVEPAETKGLGWPLTKTAPQWYRLRRQV